LKRARSLAVCLALAVAGALGHDVARADPSPQDRALAGSLFQDAKALVKSGDLAAACPKFAESQRLDPQVGTLLYLATCHQEQGKTASAWVEFNDVARAAHAAHQSDRESLARARAKELEPRLAHITVNVKNAASGLEVRVDGTVLSSSAWGTAFPIDPGPHALRATAEKHEPWSADVNVEDARALVVEVPELAAEAPPPPPAPANVAEPRREARETRYAGDRTAAFIALGVGAAGIAAGSVFGVMTIDKKNDIESLKPAQCVDNRCPQSILDKESDARTFGWVSTAGFAVGVIGAGAGAYLLFRSKPAAHAWLAPIVTAREAGVGGGVSF
jgi:hypothetical protein